MFKVKWAARENLRMEAKMKMTELLPLNLSENVSIIFI